MAEEFRHGALMRELWAAAQEADRREKIASNALSQVIEDLGLDGDIARLIILLSGDWAARVSELDQVLTKLQLAGATPADIIAALNFNTAAAAEWKAGDGEARDRGWKALRARASSP